MSSTTSVLDELQGELLWTGGQQQSQTRTTERKAHDVGTSVRPRQLPPTTNLKSFIHIFWRFSGSSHVVLANTESCSSGAEIQVRYSVFFDQYYTDPRFSDFQPER